jgi:hypothetical protein
MPTLPNDKLNIDIKDSIFDISVDGHGDKGNTGPQGPPGIPGPAGSNGLPGEDGATPNLVGNWSSGTQYNYFDAVRWTAIFEGGEGTPTGLWLAIVPLPTLGAEPGEIAGEWSLIASDGWQGVEGLPGVDGQGFTWKGIWDSGTSYVPYDVVFYLGSSYNCLTANSNDAPPSANWELIAQKGADGSSAVIPILYVDLMTAISTSDLTAGSYYLITDYKTIHYIVDGNGLQYLSDIIEGDAEPLLVFATSVNTLDKIAFSSLYPKDIIYYDYNSANWLLDYSFSDLTDPINPVIIPGFKGVIYFRHDTILDNSMGYDFRNVKFRRWDTAVPEWDDETLYFTDDLVRYNNKIYRAFKDSWFAGNQQTSIQLTGSSGEATITGAGGLTKTVIFDTDLQTQQTSIQLTGTEGEAEITEAGGLTKTVIFDTDLTTTASNFVTANAADYLLAEIILTSVDDTLFFTANVTGVGFTNPIITNTITDLLGTLNYIQVNAPNLTNTATNFVTANAADYLAQAIILTSVDDTLFFTAEVAGVGFTDPFIYNSTTPDLTGIITPINLNITSDEPTTFGSWDEIINLTLTEYWNNNPTSTNGILSGTNYVDVKTFAEGTGSATYELSCLGNWFDCFKSNVTILLNTVFFLQDLGYASVKYNQIKANCMNNTFGGEVYNLLLGFNFTNNQIGNIAHANNIGNNCTNNIFADAFYANTIADSFSTNIISYACYENIIGTLFSNNKISSGFASNTINYNFSANKIHPLFVSNNIAVNFTGNIIGSGFRANITTGLFDSNTIGDSGFSNVIAGEFYGNVIGNNFSFNTIEIMFYENIIANDFSTNKINSYFNTNTIGNNFVGNIISRSFCENTTQTSFYNNIIGKNAEGNNFGINTSGNTIGDNASYNNIGDGFTTNTIGSFCAYNTIAANFNSNTIANFFGDNIILGTCSANKMGHYFSLNILGNDCSLNIFGDAFSENVIGTVAHYNTFGINCTMNTIGDDCTYNNIGINAYGNDIGDYFTANTIGNNFGGNNIGNNCRYNKIGGEFSSNTMVDFFQSNEIADSIASLDFTSATHVYLTYNKTIQKRVGGSVRLLYINNSDVQIIVSALA